mmetsp:Transcript_14717/g.36553  ORF Transcript_14717/g.36553 Transcript_14717/m.36553 type:complete len:136 (-) Transcript_14717:265-672(-)
MQDSSDDDAAPEEPSLESSASPSIRMSLNMGSLTSSGSNLFKEEDAAIKGGEVTLNFTDEAAGKEFRLNFAVGQTVEFVKAKIKDEWERLDVGADAPVEGFKLVFDGTDMLDPMSLSDVAGIEAGKTVSIIMQRK